MDVVMKRVSRELKYEGHILNFYEDTMEFRNGNTEKWDFIAHKGAAAVVPVTADGEVLLVRQYRNALERFTLELPAGALNYAGEPKDICAARELAEETGYTAGKLSWLIDINTTVAFCNEKIGVFLAEDLIPGKQHLDPNEFCEVEKHSFSELFTLIYSGKITDGKTVAGLFAAYEKLKNKTE